MLTVVERNQDGGERGLNVGVGNCLNCSSNTGTVDRFVDNIM